MSACIANLEVHSSIHEETMRRALNSTNDGCVYMRVMCISDKKPCLIYRSKYKLSRHKSGRKGIIRGTGSDIESSFPTV